MENGTKLINSVNVLRRRERERERERKKKTRLKHLSKMYILNETHIKETVAEKIVP